MHVSDIEEIAKHVVVNSAHTSKIDSVYSLIAESRALLKGHFALQSGRHSEYFFRFRNVGQDKRALEQVASLLLASDRREKPMQQTVVLSAESAGFYLGRALAKTLRVDTAVAKIDLRRRPTGELRSGKIEDGARVIIACDVVTTGSSLESLIKFAKDVPNTTIEAAFTFAASKDSAFSQVLNKHRIPGEHLVQSTWDNYAKSPECPGCDSETPLLPASEFN